LEPFKNNYSAKLVTCISDHLQKHLSSFDRSSFEKPIQKDLKKLELKERAQLIADHLHRVLPDNHKKRRHILRAILHPEDMEQTSDQHGISGWGMMPLTMVIGQHGIDDFEESLILLKDMTRRFTSEFGVRYFLLADQNRALKIMSSWTNDKNYHVRRLVSEGTRPRLPWAMQLPELIKDPAPMLPLLAALRDDKEEYVRRSVANHLNDIAKDHPDLIANLAVEWMMDADKIREKLIRHACRTLIKQGHPVALKAFGYTPPNIRLCVFQIETKTIKLGNTLTFSTELRSTSKGTQSLLIDYLVHFKKANGTLTSKVFKWKRLTLLADETVTLNRKHAIRPITTRKYYSGKHALSLRINGQDFGFVEFNLAVPKAR